MQRARPEVEDLKRCRRRRSASRRARANLRAADAIASSAVPAALTPRLGPNGLPALRPTQCRKGRVQRVRWPKVRAEARLRKNARARGVWCSPRFSDISAKSARFRTGKSTDSSSGPVAHLDHARVGPAPSFSVPDFVASAQGSHASRLVSRMDLQDQIGGRRGGWGGFKRPKIHPGPCQWRLVQVGAGAHRPNRQRPGQTQQ